MNLSLSSVFVKNFFLPPLYPGKYGIIKEKSGKIPGFSVLCRLFIYNTIARAPLATRVIR